MFIYYAKNYILKAIINYYYTDILSDKNEILYFLHKNFGWQYNTEMDNEIKKEYEKYMNELKNGNIILSLNDVDYMEELHDILNNMSHINNGPKFLEIRRL